MRIIIPLSLLSFSLMIGGCTANFVDPEISFTPPKYVEEMPSREEENVFVARGSLFGQGDSPLFSDHKAMHVNDIVTVVISETATSSNVGSKALSESDTLGLSGGIFGSGGGNGAVSSAANKLNGLANISLSGGSTSAYSGSGSATKNASFSTTVSARIVKVMSNGNYFITGRREIMVDQQKQIMQLSGVIRPYDIDQNNQISSAKVSDAKIMYANEGDIDRSNNQGWGSKIANAVWPF
ncbi:flagellar basal body L-ring protein FlgH [Sulfuricurvum sp.]|jgi:flagellar L-ring protein precursor FlgH|uniref:flagellar basal body L-ring protein FlgH n=2 Tax=Sulfuricurvum sp. TaxID=2025608 RepID=UPI0026076BA1|nr:flagellar basal body L-ring protein FlgH [Sulfuricurvum sp.]MDD3596090.1 flagellar basal body L-ring protein FlgH [Sulfuricurvum sp.]MDD4884306.1 flagellar basal body L-ring protein FlgH [Sulfuricurvum sp.]